MESAFQIQIQESTLPTIVVRGELDFNSAEKIRDAVGRFVDQGRYDIWLDTTGLEFIDSSGVSALVDSAKLVEVHRGRLCLVRPGAHLTRLLGLLGLVRFFDLELGDEAEGDTWQPGGSSVPPEAQFSVPCRLDLVAQVRDRVAEIARTLPFSPQDIADVKVAVGEATSNAFRHGCRGIHGAVVRVHCQADDHALVVEITDPGCGFDSEGLKAPVIEEIREGGMGVHFMRLLMDRVEYRIEPQGCTVRLEKRASSPARPAVPRSAQSDKARVSSTA